MVSLELPQVPHPQVWQLLQRQLLFGENHAEFPYYSITILDFRIRGSDLLRDRGHLDWKSDSVYSASRRNIRSNCSHVRGCTHFKAPPTGGPPSCSNAGIVLFALPSCANRSRSLQNSSAIHRRVSSPSNKCLISECLAGAMVYAHPSVKSISLSIPGSLQSRSFRSRISPSMGARMVSE